MAKYTVAATQSGAKTSARGPSLTAAAGVAARIVEVGVTTTTLPPAAECGDAVDDGSILASDALFVLRASVGTAACALCTCDVNDNGETTASDALAVLRVAVGQQVELDCPACG